MVWLAIAGLTGAGVLGFWSGRKSADTMDTLWILAALAGGVIIGCAVVKE